MKKKIVWLPYDFDTALGINNEGALVFDYALEDTDLTPTGADVYNGQDSVVWNNIRMAFANELAEMYKTLRSTGKLSYDKVEQMFEDHQSKWPENIFNEDAWFKYILPLIEDGTNYLDMLQGSKAEQRKWWLYNRFRYIDSKYNAGDALSDYIALRGYARGNAEIVVTPYADIYPTIKYGSYLVSERGSRNTATTVEMPDDLTTLNDTEVYIYSASQIASIGDISSMQIGLCDVSKAVNLQSLKIGDSTTGWTNNNLYALTLGNNRLLKTLDVRNCVGLGDTTKQGHTQTTVDISGCSIIENVYFDGTSVAGVTLPNGGVLKVLHLPETITNLTILNQNGITDLSIPSYSNLSTLRIENCPTVDTKIILSLIPANTRVRLMGFYWTAESGAEITSILDLLDTMRGLDENGNNVDTAQVSGEIHTASLTGSEIAQFNERYPYLRVTADHTSAQLSFYNGSTLLQTITVLDGANATYSGANPTRSADAQYTYDAFIGWSKGADDNTVDSDALTSVVADRNVFACYIVSIKKYTVTWKNADGTVLETDTEVPYGTMPSYNGATPSYDGELSNGWNPPVDIVTGNVIYTATYIPTYNVNFYNESTLLQTVAVKEGNTAAYTGANPTSTIGTFIGWDHDLTNVTGDFDVFALFDVIMVEPDLKYLNYTLNTTSRVLTLNGLNTSLLISDNVEYITIPDTIHIDGVAYTVVLN